MYCCHLVKCGTLFWICFLIPFTQGCFVPSLVGSGEKDFFNFINVFLLCRYYFPLEKAGAVYLNKLTPLSPKDALCQVWLKLSHWFCWRRFFFISLMRFCYIVIIFPWKTAGSFIWTNLNPLHPRMLCAKFGWNWLDGSWEQHKNVKSFQNDRWKDDRQQAIRKAHWSFQLSRS